MNWRLAGPVRVLSRPQDGSQWQVMRVVGGSRHCCRATARQSGSLTASTCPWSRDSSTGPPQSKITDGREWSERRGDPQGVQRAGKWLSIRASSAVWISLAWRWEKARILRDHGNETWVHGWLGGWVGRRWLVGQRGGGSGGWRQERRRVLVEISCTARIRRRRWWRRVEMIQFRLGLGHGTHAQGSCGQWVGGGRGDAG